jgi:hypothetical protein
MEEIGGGKEAEGGRYRGLDGVWVSVTIDVNVRCKDCAGAE